MVRAYIFVLLMHAYVNFSTHLINLKIEAVRQLLVPSKLLCFLQ